MTEPRWVDRTALLAIHLDQIREHGGLQGVRDETALDSALNRARQKWHYGETPDVPILAAAYAFGLSPNHPFRDGNKRTAFLAMIVFLGLNGWDFEADEADVVQAMVALAAGKLSEDDLAVWIRDHSTPNP